MPQKSHGRGGAILSEILASLEELNRSKNIEPIGGTPIRGTACYYVTVRATTWSGFISGASQNEQA